MSERAGREDEDRPKGSRRPLMAPETARIEGAIEHAIARGDFDDLPGAGKPLNLPTSHDPDWWIKQRIAEDDVDRDALLPPVVLLRREHQRRDETLAELPDEQTAADYARDYTDRVLADRSTNPHARMLAPELDPDDAVARWRELRAERRRQSWGERTGTPPDAGPARGRPARRRWWAFGRRV